VIASSLFYFYCGAVTVLLCVVAYFILLTLPISKEFLKFGIDNSQNISETDEEKRVLSNPNYASYSLLESQESDKIGRNFNSGLPFPSFQTPSNVEMIIRTPTRNCSSNNTTIAFNSPHSETFRPFVMDVGGIAFHIALFDHFYYSVYSYYCCIVLSPYSACRIAL